MDQLLASVLDAHGGLERWREVTRLTAELSTGGFFWAVTESHGVVWMSNVVGNDARGCSRFSTSPVWWLRMIAHSGSVSKTDSKRSCGNELSVTCWRRGSSVTVCRPLALGHPLTRLSRPSPSTSSNSHSTAIDLT
ncbi:MAG: hypothetical protein JO027_01625 [Solirubrobacterales bacterium]|nr:hypothetical protein [Solirubrobacterales bacterium]MBV9837699.1 hypothetical protein [Solirubrobacterales bacterium]